jgi:predicted nucleic acid-binding protein
MGLAIARCRRWSVLTDERKVRRIAKELGVPVLGTPEIVRQWATATHLGVQELSQVLDAIERFANDRPAPSASQYKWWVASIRAGDSE